MVCLRRWKLRLFHRYAASRQAINHIHFLNSDSGERIDSQSGIQDLCVEYFSSLLGGRVSQPLFIQSNIDLLFDFRCSDQQAGNFQKPFSAEDIKKAFFTLPMNKTRGSDGYSAEFFTPHGLLLVLRSLKRSWNFLSQAASSSNGILPTWSSF